jgi:hypothetical protein
MEDRPAPWSFARRVVFRFVFVYTALFVAPFPLDVVPKVGDVIDDAWAAPWKVLVPWVGAHVLGIRGVAFSENGSGDKTFDWVSLATTIMLASIATAAWSVLDRRHLAYPKLAEWLQVLLRYSLCFAMLGYGLAKVYKSQFPFPGPERMGERLGQMSPMGLLWTFMGYSTAYTVFGGVAECVGGLLLLFRRTTTLGALAVAGVMANVVMLNFCYDVPVKIYSSQLLLMALLILAPDAQRLFDVLVLHRAVAARTFEPHFVGLRARRAAVAAKIALIGVVLFARVPSAREAYATWGDGAPRAALHGIWKVESFTRDGQDVPATDPERWERVVINDHGRLTVARAGEGSERLWYTDEAEHHVLKMHLDADEKIELTYARADDTHLTFDGDFRGAKIAAKLRKLDEGSFPLSSRGFHWVNEFPFNQ